jgi:hypothetical protein
MGHGLVDAQDSTIIDAVALHILEHQYSLGVARESNRKGIFDMHQACENKMPSLLVPDPLDIARWLAGRLKRAKEGKPEPSEKKRVKSDREKKQEEAASLSREHKKECTRNDAFSGELFRNKYVGVLLAFSGEEPAGGLAHAIEDEDIDIRIVTDVYFDDDEERWYATTDYAVQSELDPNEFVAAESGNEGTLDIRIDSGSPRRPALGTYIRRYNARLSAYYNDIGEMYR